MRSLGVEPTEQFIIRPAHWDDCLSANKIDKIVKPEFSWPLDWFQNELTRDCSRFWVLENGVEVIGYCVWWQTDSKMEILNLAIHPDYQRMGAGKFLFLKVLKEGIRGRLLYVDLELREDNEKAFKFYRKFRFHQMGIRKKYYKDGNNAILMRRAFL